MKRLSIVLSTALGSLSLAGLAHAAPGDVPTGTAGQDPATAGSTELEGQGEFAAPVEKPEETTDATEFDMSAGGIFSTGNARAIAITGASNFRLRRKIHQASANLAGNYAMAALSPQSSYEPTTGNVQGRARYDVFVHDRVSIFTMATARHDPFQGLELRFNVDPGVAVYALTKAKHRLWFEAGYDFQYDIRTNAAILLKDDGGNIVLDDRGDTRRVDDKTLVNHAVRLYAGYANNLSDKVSFNTGFEFLQSVVRAKRFRFVFDAGLSTQLAERLSFVTTFTLRYENEPLPNIQKLDTITAVSLAYRFL